MAWVSTEQDTWEPCFSLLCKIFDVVRTYKAVESVYSDVLANVSVLVVNESDKVVHDVKNENDVEIENVVVKIITTTMGSTRGARRDGQANVSPLCSTSNVQSSLR